MGLLLFHPGLVHASGAMGIEGEGADDPLRDLPDPQRPWRAEDYERAVTSLEGMPPSALPRLAGSGRSRLLFERLLVARESAPQGLVAGKGSSSLLWIYAEAVAVDARLWPELVEIGRRELEIRCRAALPRSALEGASEAEVARFEASPQKERDAAQLKAQLALYAESIQHVSIEVGAAAERLILFGHEEAMGSEARARWVAALEATAGCVAERVLEQEGARLAEQLHEGSRLSWNADVAVDLHRIADHLISDSLSRRERLGD
ncbi:MAG: hypothetical protein JRG86_11255 [Deltaproteobacteria bacterium]|nr:hypothetical protein [Deltaproteobacteria bacterium]MBW2498460.1 hypothetical protein [Deltaproteobacteria bacterium]